MVGAVHRVVALQAQEAASPYLALWNRIADFDPAEYKLVKVHTHHHGEDDDD